MKDKVKTIIIVAITIILTAGTTVAASIAISASNITIDSDKTDKTNVADALDDLYEKAGNCPEGHYCIKRVDGVEIVNQPKKCIRATTLHQDICDRTESDTYCSATESIGNGNMITYGNQTITPGELHTGDAFTCDVNGDGIYDEETERFYYVSDLYTETISNVNQFDSTTAVLVYYMNTKISNNVVVYDDGFYLYSSDGRNNKGPTNLVQYLPTKNQWSNIRLKNETRQIRTNTGTISTTAGTIDLFTYTDKVARIITLQELRKGCPNASSIGGLDNDACRCFMENTNYSKNSTIFGYWLETPFANTTNEAWYFRSNYRTANDIDPVNASYKGVRPVIEVAKSDISY